MLDREIGTCSKSCLCACYASSTLQELKSLHSKMQGLFFASLSTTSQQALHARLASVLLPTLAAKLFDPAGRHKLAAVQDALGELQQ
jgi:p-aminobenzoyl-glutamate transporter AbgT